MLQISNSLPEGLTAKDIKRIANFVRLSQGIPQLATARVHAVTLLWNVLDGRVDRSRLPQLEAKEIEIALRMSDLFVSNTENGSVMPMSEAA